MALQNTFEYVIKDLQQLIKHTVSFSRDINLPRFYKLSRNDNCILNFFVKSNCLFENNYFQNDIINL